MTEKECLPNVRPIMVLPTRIDSYELAYDNINQLTITGMYATWRDVFLPILSVNTPTISKPRGPMSDGTLAKINV